MQALELLPVVAGERVELADHDADVVQSCRGTECRVFGSFDVDLQQVEVVQVVARQQIVERDAVDSERRSWS